MPMDMRLMIPIRRSSSSSDNQSIVVGDDGVVVIGDDGVALGGDLNLSVTLTYRGEDATATALTAEDFCFDGNDPMNFPILSVSAGLTPLLNAVIGAASSGGDGSMIRFAGPGGSIDVKAYSVNLNIIGNANASIDTWAVSEALPFTDGDPVTITLLN